MHAAKVRFFEVLLIVVLGLDALAGGRLEKGVLELFRCGIRQGTGILCCFAFSLMSGVVLSRRHSLVAAFGCTEVLVLFVHGVHGLFRFERG